MKKILLIFTLLVLLTGCTAPRVYKKNRFTKQFQEADSMFTQKHLLEWKAKESIKEKSFAGYFYD